MDKKAITEAVLKEVKSRYDLERALNAWWWRDYSGNNSARLTKAGNAAVSKVMRPYTFDCVLNNTGNGIKRLTKLKTPFYADYQNQQITIYSEQLATMIRMYDSFERYMELIQ
jgi:seryl-tRNA(Sec) selenium transferase